MLATSVVHSAPSLPVTGCLCRCPCPSLVLVVPKVFSERKWEKILAWRPRRASVWPSAPLSFCLFRRVDQSLESEMSSMSHSLSLSLDRSL